MQEKKSLLSELPACQGLEGWPWSVEVDANVYCIKENWPKISIVTPSFNQGEFIEETIRSILLQNYPNLEYIVIDGGSTDATIDVLKKYDKWINVWVSENDNGQADAINKGLKICTGEIFNWINSDDFLAENALFYIASSHKFNHIICGGVYNFFPNSALNETVINRNIDFESFISLNCRFHQPGIWLNVEQARSVGLLSIDYCYYFDRFFLSEYFYRYKDIVYINEILVNFRFHEESKTAKLYQENDAELISFYNSIISQNRYPDFTSIIKKTLNYKIIPAYLIYQWHKKHSNQIYILKMFSYLFIGLDDINIYFSRYFYTLFKRYFYNDIIKKWHD